MFKTFVGVLLVLVLLSPAAAWERGAGVGVGPGQFNAKINGAWTVNGSGVVFRVPAVFSRFLEYRFGWSRGQFTDVAQTGELEYEGILFGEKDKSNTLSIDIKPIMTHEVLIFWPVYPIEPVIFVKQYLIPISITGRGKYTGGAESITNLTHEKTFRPMLIGGGARVWLVRQPTIESHIQFLAGSANTFAVSGKLLAFPQRGISVGIEAVYEEFAGYNLVFKDSAALITAEMRF